MSETGGDLDVTKEVLDSLAAKLDAFGEGLPDDERTVLATVIAAGMQAIGAEVQGFSATSEIQIDSSFVGAPIKRYKFTSPGSGA
jgi:hypothetical protein